MTQRRRGPGVESRATSTPPSAAEQSTAGVADFDFDKSVVDAVNKELWAALFDGHFKLGVKCQRCGRWLFDGRSKRRGYGAHCAKLAAEAVAYV